MRVVVAMSGGVDSSTAAALLVEAGHEVIGIALRTHRQASAVNRACCTPDDMRDAGQVADQLGIPFYVWDIADLFAREVIEPFADGYVAGRTPNPCVACNGRVKFGPLLERTRFLNAERLATGHYARLGEAGGRPALFRAVDLAKDQSYFLSQLRAEQLAWLHFPLGGLTKAEVRQHAARLGLAVAAKPESQEICFVGSQGYAATVAADRRRRGLPVPSAGAIADQQGAVVGHHPGVHHFTRGQRRGLGLGGGALRVVTDVDADLARITVGPRQSLQADRMWVDGLAWLAPVPASTAWLQVQQRHRGAVSRCRVTLLGGGNARLGLAPPAPVAAVGQAAAIYDGDRLLGGGTVAAPPAAETGRG